jgi:hypothetical protein
MSVLVQIVCVYLVLSIWPGSKKLSPQDLNLDVRDLPPREVATLTGKVLCDPERLRPLLPY